MRARLQLAVGAVSLAGAAALAISGTSAAATGNTTGGWVTDQLGTHAPDVVDAPAADASNGECGTWSDYGGGFDTSLGGGWSYLAARSGPCRAAPSNGGWGTGSRFHVERETNGEFICRSRVQQIGSRVWFKTDKGYSWSGGTDDARWTAGC